MTTRASLLLRAALPACLIALGSGPARANGVFPSAEQIVVDPSDPSHVVVRTTYGLLTTRAAGDPWDWICETAVGYSSGYHPSIALTEGGAVLAGLSDGVAISGGDTCAWGLASGVPAGAHVVDLSVEKGAPSRVVAITASNAAGPARLWESIDGGAAWTQAGAPLPAGFTPLTVDVAPSDPMRVYVSAQVSTKGALLVSLDRGQTWQSFTVPAASAEDQPYIGAVDPVDADRVYIRTDGVPGRLLVFDHATITFTEIFFGAGLLRGFALSPDGQTLLVGGGSDGIQRAPAATFTFEKVSSVQTRCLAWTSAGVYTCASRFPDGFTIGLSRDEGATFEPVLTQPCVRGPLECDPATTAGAACPSEWPAVAIQIDTKECTAGSGGGAVTTGAGGTGGDASGAGGSGAATGEAGDAGGDAPAADCACTVARGHARDAPARDPSELAWASGIAMLTALFRRSRRRAPRRAEPPSRFLTAGGCPPTGTARAHPWP
jgi:hypothetical protein